MKKIKFWFIREFWWRESYYKMTLPDYLVKDRCMNCHSHVKYFYTRTCGDGYPCPCKRNECLKFKEDYTI